jgi:hypothetical protein
MDIFKPYQYVNILSLDVVAGSVICSLFFARIFNTEISLPALMVLALTVWVIYTVDHLRDARSISKTASTDRHRFHQKHFRPVLGVLVVVAAADFILLWFVPSQILLAGVVLWCLVFIYLLFQRYLKFFKEFVIACLYTAGILLPSMAMGAGEFHPLYSLLIIKFLITALTNLLLFSFFDHRMDQDHEQESFVTWFGPASTRYGILFLGLLNIVSGIWLWNAHQDVALIFMGMNAILLTILLFQKRLMGNNHYRILGDAVFFIPLFYLL